ncbi:unnamed protein product [Somion occarium]|uniref:CAP-Gly domain-containing protein n=1 Tax=Somion occarium TaxID=3059160 RepID=A0ABP1DIH3_9APHY
MSTPSAGKPRLTGIPTPGRTSSIPTPGRLRSSSSATFHPPQSNGDDEYIAQAFAEAIKANDPNQHRTSDSLTASLSPNTANFSALSGRRSVVGRSPSVASTSSSVGRPRTSDPPLSASLARPPSRTSDTFARSSSRAGRTFDVGDLVRIESLGFEGTLRYLGGIDGKPGLWAGVELSGGFAGKGKNDGSVAGKQYFSCPPLCGVFVATTKLSAPTVSYGSISRPSSVASVRNGRMTPSISGRVTPSSSVAKVTGRPAQKTPSISSGRVTPSFMNGRSTPSTSIGRKTPAVTPTAPRILTTVRTPSATRTRSSTSYLHKTPIKQTMKENSITPGSRASRYIGMTAKQLGNGHHRAGSLASSPSRKFVDTASPTRLFGITSPTQNANSPTRSTASPFQTPKARVAGLGNGTPSRARSSISTPKGRLPSAVAMPPPASPSHTNRSGSGSGTGESVSDLESNSRALQDKIAELMQSRDRSSRPGSSASVPAMPSPLPSAAHNTELRDEIERLNARLDAAEDENKRLRGNLESAESTAARLGSLTEERDKAKARVTELEASARSAERLVKERDATIESLERSVQQVNLNIGKVRSEGEAKVRDTQSKLEDKEALVTQLKQLIEAKEGEQTQNNDLLQAKNAEIALLEARVHKAYVELEEERRELGAQVDELRKAGQETIALYEERLSVADSRRYEMEDLVASLEEQLRNAVRPTSPTSAARHASSAAEIDNETLRIQVQHLQKKIGSLEDLLEDARATADREEETVRERIVRYKEREDELRKEVNDGRKEIERVMKSEGQARLRVEEIEEALRENTVALENARAEIEGLRSEVAHLEGLAAHGAGGSPPKSSQLLQEVSQLKVQLAEQRSRASSVASLHPLKEELDHAKADKAAIEAALQKEREAVTELQYQLEERSTELETETVKTSASPSKHDLTAAREEIKGLKHIVQELQKENSAIVKRSQALESENRLLSTEIEQLREDMKTLEDNVEQSLLREESMLNDSMALSDVPGDAAAMHQNIRELKLKYESELEQMRKRLTETEMKSARTVHQLNKEIGELETLIESKIYREDELELEVEKLQERLARSQKKSSKGLPDVDERSSTSIRSSTSTLRSDKSDESVVKSSAAGEEVCEICERPGHDIFSCDLLKDDEPAGKNEKAADLFCEDCEERGHTAANCPHSLDVF